MAVVGKRGDVGGKGMACSKVFEDKGVIGRIFY
jgi:hypothetical protein